MPFSELFADFINFYTAHFPTVNLKKLCKGAYKLLDFGRVFAFFF
jgi:hypothetical protein